MILIVNYRGQYVHRIWRSLKYLGVESEMVPMETPIERILERDPRGIILSGGPYSVYEDDERLGDYAAILEIDVPILGICLGHQLIAHHFGGSVVTGTSGEYAEVELTITDHDVLFAGLPNHIKAWESHRDECTMAPPGFKVLAESAICPVEAMRHPEKSIFGVQFHPEVEHTPEGPRILQNFVGLCEKKSLRTL